MLAHTAQITQHLATMNTEACCCTEPMVDAWPFKLEYRHAGLHRHIGLHSAQRLNLVVTPAAFRSLGDVRSFGLLLRAPQVERTIPQVAMRAMGSWLGLVRGRVTTLYRQAAPR